MRNLDEVATKTKLSSALMSAARTCSSQDGPRNSARNLTQHLIVARTVMGYGVERHLSPRTT